MCVGVWNLIIHECICFKLTSSKCYNLWSSTTVPQRFHKKSRNLLALGSREIIIKRTINCGKTHVLIRVLLIFCIDFMCIFVCVVCWMIDANLAGLKISLIYHISISGIIYYSHLFYKYKMYLTPDTIAAKLIKAYKTLLLLPYKAKKKSK